MSHCSEILIVNKKSEIMVEAHEKEYTTEGFCIDCYYENCFDYDFDFAVNKWLHNNNEDNGFLISQLYAQCVLKNI